MLTCCTLNLLYPQLPTHRSVLFHPLFILIFYLQSSCSGVYDLKEIPINIDGLVLVYSINGVDTVNAATPKLRLDRYLFVLFVYPFIYKFSRDTIVAIYNGTISSWDDPRIVALNPSLAPVSILIVFLF